MKVELSSIENEPQSFRHQATLDPEQLDPDQVADAMEVTVEGAVRRLSEGFLLEGSIACQGALMCSRCLGKVPWTLEESFSVELRPSSQGPVEEGIELEDGELDVVFYTEEVLDLEALAAEQIMLAAPMKPICSADCAGLCPRCGGNLNSDGECRCEPEVDPRWKSLRGLTVGHDAD